MVVLVGAASSSSPSTRRASLSCQRSLSLPRLAWSSTLIPPPRRKNVDAERCGDLEVPLNHSSGGGKPDSSGDGALLVVAEPFEVEEEEEEQNVRHEKIRADDRCTRHGRPMFALDWIRRIFPRHCGFFLSFSGKQRSLAPLGVCGHTDGREKEEARGERGTESDATSGPDRVSESEDAAALRAPGHEMKRLYMYEHYIHCTQMQDEY